MANSPTVALGTALRHNHCGQFTPDAYHDDARFFGIESSPTFVRTMKEQLLWLRRFATVEAFQRPVTTSRTATRSG